MKKILFILIILLSASFAYAGTWGDSKWDQSIFGQDPPDICTDNDSDGYFVENNCGSGLDCNDDDASINPGFNEMCDDGIDNNCNGTVDEDCGCVDEPLPTKDETIVLITAEEIANSPVTYTITPSALVSSIGFETNFPKYCSPVDIYLLMITPDERLIFINSDGGFTEDLVPYVTNQGDALNISVTNAGAAMAGNYLVGWFLAPANGGNVVQSLNDGMYVLGAYVLLN